jgi:diguanylate cyclase (GGDEF)-like protein
VYLSHLIVVPGRRVYLLDAAGRLIASSGPALQTGTTLGRLEPRLAQAIARHGQGTYASPAGDQAFVAESVAGTPWRVVAVAPSDQVYESTGGPAKWLPWLALVGLGITGLAVLGTGSLLWRNHDRLDLLNGELDRLARTDVLTGLRNRRDIEESVRAAISYARRHDTRLAVLLIDIDHFKRVNDTLGHRAGDTILGAAAESIRSLLREEDSAGRWGGEEFLALLPETDAAAAEVVAERLRAGFEQLAVPGDPQAPAITATIGVAEWNGREDLEALISRADRALYEGKAAGRNQVRVDRTLTLA